MVMYIVRDVTVHHLAEETRNREKRMFSMGKLSTVLAHEIRNPLNTISMIIQRFKNRESYSEEETQMLDIIASEIDRMNQHVTDYIRLSRLPDVNIQPVPIRRLVKSVQHLYQVNLENAKVILSFGDIPEDAVIQGDPDQMRGILANLLDNSIHAGATRIRLTLETRTLTSY